MKSVASEQLV